MKLEIKDYCVRCGICQDLYPELFHVNLEKDYVEVKYDEIPAELEQKAKDAIRDCSIAAIHIVR